jgi:hypothetical protein
MKIEKFDMQAALKTVPADVKNEIRKLHDNDGLVAQIWCILSAYCEIRDTESRQVLREDAGENIDAVLTQLKALEDAMAYSDRHNYFAGGYPPKFDQYIDEMRGYWSANRDKLKEVPGRITRQESLYWLAEKLADVFTTWAIPPKKLSGFIVAVTSVILPDGVAPSRRSIQAAIKEARN